MTKPTLWYTRCPSPTAASVAIRKGWLEDEFAPDGIQVLSLASSKDKKVQLSHYQHTQENSFRFGGNVPPLVSASRGADIKIIGLARADRTSALYSLPSSGIRTAEDLRGKRFSVPKRLNDALDWWQATVLKGYETGLARGGLTFADVQLVDVNINREYIADATQGEAQGKSLWGARSQFAVQREEVAALLRGEVDVIYSDAAMGALVNAFLGLVTVVDISVREGDSTSGPRFPSVLTVSGGLLRERPDLVQRWLSRLLDAEDWARNNENEAKHIFADDTGLPFDFVDDAYSADVHKQLEVSLAPARLEQLQLRHDHLLAAGFLARPLDLADLVDATPLNAALAARQAHALPEWA